MMPHFSVKFPLLFLWLAMTACCLAVGLCGKDSAWADECAATRSLSERAVVSGEETARETVTVSKNEIEAMVAAFLTEKLEDVDSDACIGQIRGAREVTLPAGRLTHVIQIPTHESLAGNVRVNVSFSVDGKPAGRDNVYVRINRMVKALTAARPMGKGLTVTAADVVLKKMDATRVSSNALVRIEDAVGKLTRKRIEANVVLRPDMVERPYLVERGDIVRIVARTDQIRITTLGEVRKKGRENDRIRVLNLDSEQDVYARVVDANTVAVNF